MNISITFYFFVVGAVLASFYGVVGERLLRHESIVKPRSHCTFCNHELKAFELIPIFSYFLLKGKCRYCKKKLNIYYPIMEFLTGLLFAISYMKFEFSYELWISLILISLMVLIFITDLKEMIILDSPLIISVVLIFFLKWFYFDIKTALLSLTHGLVLFIFMLIIGFLGRIIYKREALGGGDIKLSFVIGMTLGIPMGFISLVLSTFLALPYATFSLITKTSKEVPYGPFLAGSLYLVFMFVEKFSYLLAYLYF